MELLSVSEGAVGEMAHKTDEQREVPWDVCVWMTAHCWAESGWYSVGNHSKLK